MSFFVDEQKAAASTVDSLFDKKLIGELTVKHALIIALAVYIYQKVLK